LKFFLELILKVSL